MLTCFPIERGRRGKVSSKTFLLDFRFEEGLPKTITRLSPFGSGSSYTVYLQSRKRGRGFVEPDEKFIQENITVSLVTTPEGQKAVVLENRSRKTVYFELEIYGDYIIGGETETYVYEDIEAIEETKHVFSTTIDSSRLSLRCSLALRPE